MKFRALTTTTVNPPARHLEAIALKEGQEYEITSIGEYRLWKTTLDRLEKGKMLEITSMSYPSADELRARAQKKVEKRSAKKEEIKAEPEAVKDDEEKAEPKKEAKASKKKKKTKKTTEPKKEEATSE